MAGQALEAEFDTWQKANASSDLVWLNLEEKPKEITFLHEGMDEFTVVFPATYPSYSKDSAFKVRGGGKGEWMKNVGEFIKKEGNSLTLSKLLTNIIKIKKQKPAARKKMEEDDDEDEEEEEEEEEEEDVDMEGGAYGEVADDAGDFDLDSEELKGSLEILRMKKRWAKKEAQIREEMKKKKEEEKKNTKIPNSQKVEQIFSTQAASGILTNDLLSIMELSQKIGVSAEPIDDNIYHWNVKLFKFPSGTEIDKQLKELEKIYNYNYIELEITFTIDLFPFYPPQVKVIRPRFQGFMMGRITSMETLKLSYWDPVKDMKGVIDEIRQLIQDHGKLDVNNPLNNPSEYPRGAYSELEYLLLRLELLSEQDPRANLIYPTQFPPKKIMAPTKPKEAPVVEPPKPGQKGATSSTYWSKGTGYGHAGQAQWDVNAYIAAQKQKDQQTESVLHSISKFIVQGKITDAQFQVIEESCLVPFIESYLKNDSLLDIDKHQSLYSVIFDLIQAFAQKEALVPLLDKLPHQSTSLYDLMKSLYDQASFLLKSLEKARDDGTASPATPQMIAKTFAVMDKEFQKYRSTMAALEKEMGPSKETKLKEGDLDLTKPDVLARVYEKCLKSLQFGTSDMKRGGSAYKHHYASHANAATKAGKDKILRLAQEQGSLTKSLPLNVDSSVFMRVDTSRMDVVQAMITGPVDTPYSGGCFQFDIFFNDNYPNGPPLVNLETTGGGTVRFNPNLYHCGKVCLSLLGTWGGEAAENWNRDTSTFLQILVSIQSLILVPRPYFNEPGYERQMNTPQGDAQNRAYNENIRVATVEWAMSGQLSNPSPGFEEVIKTHFYLKADFLRKQCEQWLAEAKASNQVHYNRLLKVVKDFYGKLDQLPAPAKLYS